MKCVYCKTPGHKLDDCQKRKAAIAGKKKQSNVADKEAEEKVVFMAQRNEATIAQRAKETVAMPCTTEYIEWYVDSGATNHIVNEESYFSKIETLEVPISISSAKIGSVLQATKIGDICYYQLSIGHHVSLKTFYM